MDVSGPLQLFLIFIIFCLTAIYLLFNRNYQYWEKRGVPYEKPFFLFGSLSFILRKSFWDYFYELSKRHTGDYVGIFLGFKPTLIVQTPEIARRILVKDNAHFNNRYCYSSYGVDPLGSLNLFTVKNPKWSNIRHELSPMFTSLRLKTICELMNVNAKELVLKIQRDYIDNNEDVNLKELFSMYTSDTVGYTVFGLRVSALNDPSSPLWFITNHMVKWDFWRGFEFTAIFFVPALARFLRLKFFSQPATEYIMRLFRTVVDERKKTNQNTDKDLVNHLLKLKENLKLGADIKLADEIMMAQAAVFILGSIETSSSTLSYCLHELAYHPEEQQKLFEEVDDAIKETGKEILDYENLQELKYLSACIIETLRKYPPVPHIDRVCNKTYKLNDELTIEEDIPVFVNVLAIHRNEKYYPEPDQWRPERMIGVTDNDNLQYTFLPFGDGPRFCIGKRYGLLQMRAAIAQMIHKYKFEAAEPHSTPSDPYSVILSPKSGGRIKFVPR